MFNLLNAVNFFGITLDLNAESVLMGLLISQILLAFINIFAVAIVLTRISVSKAVQRNAAFTPRKSVVETEDGTDVLLTATAPQNVAADELVWFVDGKKTEGSGFSYLFHATGGSHEVTVAAGDTTVTEISVFVASDAEEPAEEPAEPVEEPVEEVAPAAAEEPVEDLVEEPIEGPVEEAVEVPAEEPAVPAEPVSEAVPAGTWVAPEPAAPVRETWVQPVPVPVVVIAAEKKEEPDEDAEESEDEDMPLLFGDLPEGGPRYELSFKAKLMCSADRVKGWYTAIKNELLSYGKTKGRLSWKRETFKSGRDKVLARVSFRGKTLCIFLPLEAAAFEETKYKVEDASRDTPCVLYRIRSDRKAKYCKDLIALAAEGLGLARVERTPEDFYLPAATLSELLEEGLAKQVASHTPVPTPAEAPAEEVKDTPAELPVEEQKTEPVEISAEEQITDPAAELTEETPEAEAMTASPDDATDPVSSEAAPASEAAVTSDD